MGSSQKDPRNPETTATKERPENKAEVPKGQKTDSLEDLKKKAEKLKSDPNNKAAEAIRKLKGDLETVKQMEGLTALNQALVSVLTKLAKDGADIAKIKTTKALELAVTTSGIKLSLPEAAAVENLDQIASKSGPTAREIKNSWPDRVKAAQEGSKGWGEKYKEQLEKNPTATIALTVAGAAGIYLTFQWLTTIAKRSAAGAKAGEDRETSWFKKEIMIPLAIMAAGAVIGKDQLKKLLAECGIDYFKVEDKIKKGEEFTKDEQKKLKKGAKKIQDKINENKKRRADKNGVSVTPSTGYEEPEPVPGALETEEDKLREFGEDLLVNENQAEKLEGGMYLIITGERKTYFRFNGDEGRWEWASEWQKRDDKWAAVGTDYYKDKKKYEKANEISHKLAVGTEKNGEQRPTALPPALEDKIEKNAFDVVKNTFVALYFKGRRGIDNAKKKQFKTAINYLSDKKVSEIVKIYEAHKTSRSIPKPALPSVKNDISEKNLFLLAEALVRFSKFAQLGGREKTDWTVKQMFESLHKHPMLDRLGGLTAVIETALNKGDYGDALKAFSASGADYIKKHGRSVITRLNEELKINPETLESGEEKEAYFTLLGYLLAGAMVATDPQEAIDNRLIPHSELKKYPEAIKMATLFFTRVQKRTPDVLKKAHDRFGLEVGDKNWLKDGADFKRFTFAGACELLTLETSLRGESDWATDLVILNVLLRNCEVKARENYIGNLVKAVAKDSSQINLPAIRNLKEYLVMAAKAAGNYFAGWTVTLMNNLHGYIEDRPGAKEKTSKEMAEQMKTDFIVSFGDEMVGTGLEISETALATIISVFGLQDDILDIENGKEFLELIRLKGGKVGYFEGLYDSGTIVIDTGYQIFLARPGKTLKETARSTLEFSGDGAADAVKIWLSSSSFFVAWGGVYGFCRPAATRYGRLQFALVDRLKNAGIGAAKGLTYPARYPYKFARAVKRGAHTVIATTEGAKAVKRGTVEGGRRVINWSRDIYRHRALPGQNVQNMVITGERLKYHASKKSTGLAPGILEDEWIVWKKLKMAKAHVGRAWDTTKGLASAKTRTNTIRNLTAGDFHRRMSAKLSLRFVDQYNSFFDKGLVRVAELTEDRLKELIELQEHFERFLTNVKNNPSALDDIARLVSENKTKELKKILKALELNGHEIPALIERMSNPKKARQIVAQLRKGIGLVDTAATRVGLVGKTLQMARERLSPRTAAEKARSFGKTKTALSRAGKDLARSQKRIASAKKEIARLTEKLATKPKDAALVRRNLEAAKGVLESARISAERLKVHKHALQWVKEAERELSLLKDAKLIAQKETEIRNATKLAESTLEESSKGTQALIKSLENSKAIRSATGLKWLEVLKIANNEAIVLETSARFGKVAKNAKQAKDVATAFAKTPEAIKAINNAIQKAKDVGKATDALEAVKTSFWRFRSVADPRVAKATANLEKATKAAKTASDAAKGLTTAPGAVRAIDKATKAARKSAEALVKTQKARKVAKATKETASAARKGFLTVAEATSLSTKISTVASKGGKIMKFVRIGGRVFIVLDAVISVYDVYDQACELGKILSNEYVETGSIRKAMDKISKHTGTHAEAQRLKEEKENQGILHEKNIKNKLRGARNLAVKLKSHASSYGISRRTESGDSTFDWLWSGAGGVLSEMTGTPTIMRGIYGSDYDKLKEAEDMLIRTNTKQGREILTQLSAIKNQTEEVTKTIEALKSSIRLSRKAMNTDKPCSDAEIDGLGKQIRQAQASARKKS